MAVKKAQTENKAATGLVTVTVGAGPIHQGGRRYVSGDTLEVSEEVAAALVGAGLVSKGKG